MVVWLSEINLSEKNKQEKAKMSTLASLRFKADQAHQNIYGLCKTLGVLFQWLMKIHVLKQDQRVPALLSQHNSKCVWN